MQAASSQDFHRASAARPRFTWSFWLPLILLWKSSGDVDSVSGHQQPVVRRALPVSGSHDLVDAVHTRRCTERVLSWLVLTVESLEWNEEPSR